MLDVALIELVSAGLRRFFIDDPDAPHAWAEADSGALLRWLLVANPEAAGTLVNRCVTDQWSWITANQLPVTVAADHLARLPRILAADRTAPEQLEDFFAQSPIALADGIILANGGDTSGDSPIDETVLTFLLEVFLRSLQSCRTEIETLMPLIAETPNLETPHDPPLSYVAEPDTSADADEPPVAPPVAQPRSDATLTLEKIARADALSISVPLLELITVAVINRTRSPHLRQSDLADAAAEARAIRTELVELAIEQPFGWAGLDTLVNTFDAGRFEACSRTLTAIEEEAVRQGTATSPRVPDCVDCAIRMRLLRARLYDLQGNDIAAARQMGNAQRHVSRGDDARRWRMAIREARHYERAAYRDRDPTHFDSAARVCSSALANLSADASPPLRAEVHSELAHYLIRLGQIEQASSRFEIAAQLLESAIPDLAAAFDPHLCLLTLVRQGDALIGLARLSGADHLAERAVESYEDASQLISTINAEPSAEGDTRRPFDESVTALRARLAVALLTGNNTDADDGVNRTAVEAIIDVLPELTGPHDLYEDACFSANLLAGHCHHAIAVWLAAMGEINTAHKRMAMAAAVLHEIGCDVLAHQLSSELASHADRLAMTLPARLETAGPATAA
jgi:tetratricopeptide (TPR) repeat protein